VIERVAEAIWRDASPGSRLARIALTPFSLLFGLGASTRSWLYDSAWVRVERAPLPVISVGNLRVGGSGKTPMVLWLVERLRALGARPVVATRGYGAARSAQPTWLEPGHEASGPRARAVAELGFRIVASEAGGATPGVSDEALLVALRGEVAVAIARNRLAAARAAHAAGADVVVLDDGFQHRRLHRDLDIVLTSACEIGQQVLPAGPLREPWRALRRADVVMAPDVIAAPAAAMVAIARARAVGWVDRVAATASPAAVETWRGREVVAVAGIARPERFFDMLDDCGVRVRERRVFPDHHRFSQEDWHDVCRLVRAGQGIATTEKDLVKLRAIAGGDERLAALRVELVVEPEGALLHRVRAAMARLDAPKRGPHDP
jgi:tetraacyldisaccharide 4'-kinase